MILQLPRNDGSFNLNSIKCIPLYVRTIHLSKSIEVGFFECDMNINQWWRITTGRQVRVKKLPVKDTFFNNLPGGYVACISEHVHVGSIFDNKKVSTQYVPGRLVLETIGVKSFYETNSFIIITKRFELNQSSFILY